MSPTGANSHDPADVSAAFDTLRGRERQLGHGVSVRPADPEDVEAIATSELESFPDDAWTPDYLTAVVEGQLPTVRLLVLEYDGGADGSVVVGHAIVSILFEDAELQRIATLPSYRRRGLARDLLHAVLDLARAEGAERLLLEVRETNLAALTLYRAEGFVEIDRRERYYRDGTTGIVLDLPLSRTDPLPPPKG